MKNHFEVLANELLHEIFDYLSSNDVIQSFSYLNKRFSRLISQRLLKCDFSHLSKVQYDNLIHILPFNQIHSLKISNKSTVNIFSRISFHSMINLQILTLTHINYGEIRCLFESKTSFEIFQQLHTLKIQTTNVNGLDRERIFILKKIFSQMPKLRVCQIPLIDIHDLDELIPTLTLEQLILDYCTVICLDRLLYYIPSVQYLIVRIYTDLQNLSTSKFSPTKYFNIRSLEISTVNNISFHQIENLLCNSFNRLERLKFFFKIDVSSQSSLDYIDDKRWEYLLRSFPSLEQFSCCLELPIQSDIFTNSFERNEYFLQRNWSFIYQIHTYSFNTTLRIHTKPYPKRRLDITPSKALVDHTNNIYFRVRDLRILIDNIPIINSGIIYANIRSLTLISNKSFNEHTFLIYLYTIIKSNQLLYLIIQLDNCSKNFLLNLIEKSPQLYSLTISTYQTWSKLIRLSSQISNSSIRSLIVYEGFTDFNQYDTIYQLIHQLEILSVVVASLDDCYRLLTLLFIGTRRKSLDRLRSLTIKCDFDEPDVIAHWIRTNILRKLSYKCTPSVLTLWL